MYAREYRSTRPHKAIFFHLSCLTLICSAQVYAKPDMRPLGPNIADKGSVFYHFSVTSFDSVDGTRHYRVWTAVPNTTAPASGYPILYMLDGNAVMDRLDDELLKQLSEKTPPVIVAVGYQTNLPFDLNSRAYDYTPAAESRKTDLHSGHFSRKSGGSNNFRQLLETRIAPKWNRTEYRSATPRLMGALLRRPLRAGFLAVLLLLPVVLQRQPVVGQRL